MSTETASPKIHAAITAIMAEVGGIGKGRQNVQQNYKFRGIADVYLACQPLMAKHQVHVVPHAVLDDQTWERTTKSGGFQMHIRQRIEFRLYHADGSFVPVVATGEAMDTGDKASNKVMSAAMKYALIQAFAIPEEDPKVDTEADEPDPTAPPAPKDAAPPPLAATQPAPSGRPAAAAPKAATKPAAVPRDAEHEKCLETIRGIVGKELKWELPEALTWLTDTFGKPKPDQLTKDQAMLCKRLLTAKTMSEERYATELATARKDFAGLLKPAGAAA